MKKNYFRIAIMALVVSVAVAGCKSTKPISQQSADGFADIAKDDCQKKAEENPTIRAYGVGQHFREMTARNIAETQARAQFARAIRTAIVASTEANANSNVAYDGDMNGANIVDQQNAGDKDWAQGIADEEISNTVVISTCPRFNPTTKQYKTSVCVEYREGVSALANNISRKVQKLSDQRKLQMEFDFEQYRERIQKELEKKKNNP